MARPTDRQTPVISSALFSFFFVGGVTIWDGISKAAKEIKSRILVVGVGERVNVINNACRYGKRGEGTPFDAASCAEVEELVGTLEF